MGGRLFYMNKEESVCYFPIEIKTIDAGEEKFYKGMYLRLFLSNDFGKEVKKHDLFNMMRVAIAKVYGGMNGAVVWEDQSVTVAFC